ncbi:hypothetical protein TrVE_jg4996 [Triparma verrucosa]|uniref:Cadherin domain-containing protein n=1 Tax=Triparma verrucosa TaxID=1606542 RepID=A0A9W7F8V4_9STRA|nr:hypothetical protein TrVE_jg4996 [Triparma verrucosa]
MGAFLSPSTASTLFILLLLTLLLSPSYSWCEACDATRCVEDGQTWAQPNPGQHSACGTESCGKGNTCTKTCSVRTSYLCSNKAGYNTNGVDCAAGKYSTQGNACTNCAAGKISAAKAGSCSSCAAGKKANSWKTACDNCGAGTWSSATSDSCSGCATGKYSGAGSSACTSCGGGKYLSNSATGTESSACTVCQHGKYSTGTVNSCTDCAAGYYIADNGVQASEHDNVADCDKCGTGTYSAAGASGCTSCQPGKYSEFSGNDPRTTCQFCAKGTFAETGWSACAVCGQGKYRDTTGATSASDCANCPTGRYNDEGSSQASENDALADCEICSSGTANPNSGSTSAASCVACPAGKFAPASESASCSTCADGQFTNIAGQPNCDSCEAGKYSNDAKTGCESCPAGKVSTSGEHGISSCENCVAGKYTTDSINCVVCSSGKYAAGSATRTSCTNCAAGKYNSYDATNAARHDLEADCIVCPQGKAQPSTGQASCASCAAGTYGTGTGYTRVDQCTVCGSGKYSLTSSSAVDANGVTSCVSCAAGKSLPYSSTAYALKIQHDQEADCVNCEAGKFSSSPASASCTICPAGKYQETPGVSFCNLCAIGRYNPDAGSDVSKHTSSEGDSCLLCTAGKYQNIAGQESCMQCVAGKKSSATGASDVSTCTDCANGKYSLIGQSACTDCPAGKSLASFGEKVGDCNDCETGKYYAGTGATACTVCGQGKYVSTTAATVCDSCGTGKFLSDSSSDRTKHDEAADCSSCSPGKYQSNVGQSSCSDCGKGKTSTTGATICSDCSLGTFADSVGSSSCERCGAGKFADAGGAEECQFCPDGRYSNDLGFEVCLACPEGKYNNAAEQGDLRTSCVTCTAGKYAPLVEGADQCADCEEGKYSDTEGTAESCDNCQANSYQPNTGQFFCIGCPLGQSSVEGSTSCSACAGVITGGGCLVCSKGYYAGSSSCMECYGGSRSNGGATTSCSPCEAGKFSSKDYGEEDGEECPSACNTCAICGAGKYSNIASISCTECPAGKISKQNSVTMLYDSCEDCPAGKVTESDGQTTCSTCTAGKYASAGASRCTDCTAGKISSSNAGSCSLCDEGKYSAAGSSICTSCSKGKYADQAGMGNCVDCPSGKFAAELEKANCDDCVVGKYSASGQDSCALCSAGKTSAAGSYLCSDCLAGFFSDEGSLVGCQQCPAGKFAAFSSTAECSLCTTGYYCHVRSTSTEAGSTNSEEHKCGQDTSGDDITNPSSKYCPEGSSAPQPVQTGYYSTPTIMDNNVRQGQAPCPSSYYCYMGERVSFLEWAAGSCSTEDSAVQVEIVEVVNSPSQVTTVVHNFDIDKNTNTPAELTLSSKTFEVVRITDNSESGSSCVNANGLSADGSDFTFGGTETLKLTGNIDYESCKDGLTLTVKAVGDFDGNCYDSSSPCGSEDSEECSVNIKVNNLNEPPYWLDPQTEDPGEACYMPSITFYVPEKTSEFTEFGGNLEDCVLDPDESETVIFTVDACSDDTDACKGAKMFDVRDCGGKLFIREGTEAQSLLKYDMVTKGDPPSNIPDNTYTVTVAATDTGSLSANREITVVLTNVNDAPFWESDMPTTFTINENSSPNFEAADVSPYATDDDKDDLSFSIIQNDQTESGEDAFTIEELSGKIRTTDKFDFEVKATYHIKLAVTDGNETTIPAESPLLKIQVNNINDLPYWNNGDDGSPRESITFQFAETVAGETDASLTTQTGDIVADITSLAGDQDTDDFFGSDPESLQYVLKTTDRGTSTDFEVVKDSANTRIKVIRDTTANPFNFESAENVFTLKLYVKDDQSGTEEVNPIDLEMRLVDINEPPAFTLPGQIVEVLETICASDGEHDRNIEGGVETCYPIGNGDEVAKIEAIDVDGGQDIFMSIETADVPFVITGSQESDTGSKLFSIALTGELDFEVLNTYTVRLKVSDGQKQLEDDITIKVLNCNERPVVTRENNARTVYENSKGSFVIPNSAITVTDGDNANDVTDTFTYNIVGGSGAAFFEITSDGKFKVLDTVRLDYELVQEYYLIVEVMDDNSNTPESLGIPAISEQVTFTVNVLNVNEAPYFFMNITADSEGGSASVTESMKKGDLIYSIEGADYDLANDIVDEDLDFEIIHHDYLFEADGTTCNNPLEPAESKKGYKCCVDAEAVEVFKPAGETKLAELRMRTDLSATALPFNNLDGCLLPIRISATDQGKARRDDTSATPLTSASPLVVHLNVTGSNNNPVIYNQEFGNTFVTCDLTTPGDPGCINENSASGTEIATVAAMDPDDGQILTYKIYSQRQAFDAFEMDRFSINNKTGVLDVTAIGAGNLNFENEVDGVVYNQFNLTIGVYDDQKPPLGDLATVTIRLSNVNEPPIFSLPPRFEISEYVNNPDNPVPGMYGENEVVQLPNFIAASDEDTADIKGLTYSLKEGTPENFPFTLTTKTDNDGQNTAFFSLKAKQYLDYEDPSVKGVYQCSVTVTDTAGNAVDLVNVPIYVKDENEPPDWEFKDTRTTVDSVEIFKFDAEERAEIGSTIGSVAVVDPEGDIIVYSITENESGQAGVASSLFKINDSGSLELIAALDYEDETEYMIKVSATESGRESPNSITSDVKIKVVDVNDMVINSITPTQLSAGGGTEVVISGKDFGPKNPLISEVDIDAIYYGSDGIIYIPANCVFNDVGVVGGTNPRDRDNTFITCETVAGVGQNHEWNVTISYKPLLDPKATWTTKGSIEDGLATSYDAPVINSVVNAEGMSTPGGDTVVLEGINFGPLYKDCGKVDSFTCENYPLDDSEPTFACGNDCRTEAAGGACNADGNACNRHPDFYISDAVEVYYGPLDNKIKYQCKNAKVTVAGTKVECISAEGVGNKFYWSIKVGSRDPKSDFSKLTDQTSQYSNPYYYEDSSYLPPELISAHADLLPNGAATKSGMISLEGENLGIDGGELTLSFGNAYHSSLPLEDWYTTTDCVMHVPHKKVNCSSVPGVGTNLLFEAEIAGLGSNRITSEVSYVKPIIIAPAGLDNAVNGQGAVDAKTKGGQEIHIFGENFGPAGDPFPAEMKYGGDDGLKYTATGCYVSNSYNKITCTSSSGTGFDHSAHIFVGGQQSNEYDAQIAYARPSVHYFKPLWESVVGKTAEGASTPGGEWIVVHGENFGTVSDNAIDSITYGPNGVEFHPCLNNKQHPDSCECRLMVDHEQIRCNTTEGSGKMHRWIIKIDGQNSTVSTTSYDRPTIESITGLGATDASCDGGQAITITGKNFGPGQKYLGDVTYGPSGTEYVADNCQYVSHFEITCETAKGLGKELSWLVSVDGQLSDLSATTTNYKTPVISKVYVETGKTAGGSLHRINGTDFGVKVPNSYIEVLFDGVPIVLDGVSSTKAIQGSYLSGREPDGVDFIDFTLPPMTVLDQAKEVKMHVGHASHNVDQYSNTQSFSYGHPYLDTIENLEGDPYGLTQDPTTDLVIRGENFGTSEISSVYINDIEQPVATPSTDEAGIKAWTHEMIAVKYVGTSGTVHIQVGDLISNNQTFNKSSPELLMVDPYLPHSEGFRTIGETKYQGHVNPGPDEIRLAGCHFQKNEDNIRIEVGGVDCPLVLGSLKVVEENDPETEFCVGEKNELREVTCKVPEGTGAMDEVVLIRGGNPNFRGNETIFLHYLPPEVDSFSPTLCDTDGDEVIVSGDNFGNKKELVTIKMGGRELEIKDGTFSHTSFTVIVPPGEGVPKLINITVDGQTNITSRNHPGVFRYYYPTIFSVNPDFLDTTGGEVELTGEYFGRFGKAIASLYDSVTDSHLDDIEVNIGSQTQESMQITVGEGQGVTQVALNVSGNIAKFDLPFKPPSLNDQTIYVDTRGGQIVELLGNNFGVGNNFKISIRDPNAQEETVYDDQPGANKNMFPHPEGYTIDDSQPELVPPADFTHTGLKFKTPEGQNSRTTALELLLVVAGQESNTITFDYLPPSVANVSMCFSDSVSEVYKLECQTDRDGNIQPIGADCDPYDGENGGCGLKTDGGYTLVLTGANFGNPTAGVQSVFFGDRKLVDEKDADVSSGVAQEVAFISHTEIRVRIPPGVGTNVPIVVKVGDREGLASLFSYDPPYVEDISPAKPNAEGDILTIVGNNFGPTLELAYKYGPISILIGQTKYDENRRNYTEWVNCPGPSFGMDQEFPIWQQKGTSTPYLWCALPRTTVGPKHIMVSVAGRNVTVHKDDTDFSPKCMASYYGQEEDGIFWGPILDLCKDECSLASAKCIDSWDAQNRSHTREECVGLKHCTKIEDLNYEETQRIRNCTVLSRQDEYCRPCPGGATCEVNTQFDEEPVSMEGYWRLELPTSPETCFEDYPERKHRTHCYGVYPCNPAEACAGDNTCAFGYTGEKCDSCCDMMHRYVTDDYGRKVDNPECWNEDGERIKYFRQYGECAPCPSNPWMIVAILLGGACFGGSIAYVMKKKHVSLGIFSIGVDYLQILALLSATKTPWPQVILDLYTWLSAFNFNINITAPECAFELAYEDKWRMIMIMPSFMMGGVLVYNYFMVLVNKFLLNKHGKDIFAHSYRAFGIAVTIMYYIYLNLSMTALEVFNCSVVELEDPLTGELVSDGKQYMQETNWVCYEEGSLQVFLIPYAIVGLGIYSVGYPLFTAWALLTPEMARKSREDQILRAQDLGYTRKTNPHCYEHRLKYGKLYYYYKPKCWYWTLVVLAKKFSIASISLLFRANATFQMCMIVLCIFIAAVFQVKFQPFMSMSEREEVIKDHRDAVAEFNEEIERRRGGSLTARKKKFQLGTMEATDVVSATADYFWNYNTVETVLLASSILVNLFGLMFESNFLKEGTAPYETLANLTLTVITVTLCYIIIVVWSEIVVAVFPSFHCSFVNRFRSANEEEEEDLTMERESQKLHLELQTLEFSSNPLFQGGGKGDDGAVKALSEEDMMKQVKSHPEFIKMATDLKELNMQLRESKKAGAESKEKAKFAKFKMVVLKGKEDFSSSFSVPNDDVSAMAGSYQGENTFAATNPMARR